MTTLNVTTREGDQREITGQVGRTIMEILRDSGIDQVLALCGGSCSCATCHVYVEGVDMTSFAKLSDFESELLDCSSHRRANSRLSCQLRWSDDLDGLRVTIAPED